MNEKYKVYLSKNEVKTLKEIIKKGNSNSAGRVTHANILLKIDDSDKDKKTDKEISEIYGVSQTIVCQIRKTYATEGLEAALNRSSRVTGAVLSKIAEDFEADVIATALSRASKGRAPWTLRLLADHCIENSYIVTSHTYIGEKLSGSRSNLSQFWSIPKEDDARFVANMEDILGIYQNTYDPMIPVLCMDEKPIEFLDEIRKRLQVKLLKIDRDEMEKMDSEYTQCGYGSIFIFTEPLAGWRYVTARESRTKCDFAQIMNKLYHERYKNVEKVILVCNGLNTHSKASFYKAFSPEIAYELSQKFEFHYTPIQGSWLNIAECELSSLARDCFGRQGIDSIEELNEVLTYWVKDRNSRQKSIDWKFAIEDARTKLNSLYPTPVFKDS